MACRMGGVLVDWSDGAAMDEFGFDAVLAEQGPAAGDAIGPVDDVADRPAAVPDDVGHGRVQPLE